MATLLEAYKKRKRNLKIYDFHTFAQPGCLISPSGPFRNNIRVFLEQCAEPEAYNINGMPVWCTVLVHEDRGVLVPLYTIEESVKHSLQPFWGRCRCAGWSHHFVSKRKYHMIIPTGDGNKPLDEGVFDMPTHLLHGLIHCNGFGHLITINGTEGGSKYVCGAQIMDLWDRICAHLHVRKITVEDFSKKRSMQLRLLHGVAYGQPWFGRWGYRFCNGSFGVTQRGYENAVETLGSLELDRITQEFNTATLYRDFKRIIRYYRDLSETKLVTIRDLLIFMLTLKSKVPFQQKSATIRGLIDYVPKNLKNVVVGGLFVCQKTHNVYEDVYFVYRNFLMDYPCNPSSLCIRKPGQTILYTNLFVKEWTFEDQDAELLRFICRIVPCDFSIREVSHGELIVLPLHSTFFGDLKAEVEKAMRDTYCATENFVVTDIEGMEGTEDSEVLFGLVESGTEIRAKGVGIDSGSGLMYQSGLEDWTVRCNCGAKDFDAERMLTCGICGIWQHARCCGIGDHERVDLYECEECCYVIEAEQDSSGTWWLTTETVQVTEPESSGTTTDSPTRNQRAVVRRTRNRYPVTAEDMRRRPLPRVGQARRR